ncbi:hypothetical protein ACFP1I_03600 [Dyadobacter subterraneus]|uniref:Uncharacterized protein n=1 Tax=Dyadobacter subterraneus TaxID=2773304 RepID=A0ABR9W4D7_9BACT|nr:hypothetical protein [Dyadobacter subterraneus]MBE9460318.1 hypothetical protein [Dyadobacter subterraneus]
MKAYSKILITVLVQSFLSQVTFGQTKKSSDSVFVNSQVKPKFSEMTDYGMPTNKEGIHEFPGGKAPVSNQINSDGSIRINKTGEIKVPSETFKIIEREKKTDLNMGSENKEKNKKKKK